MRNRSQEQPVTNTKRQQRQSSRRPVTRSQLRQAQSQGTTTEVEAQGSVTEVEAHDIATEVQVQDTSTEVQAQNTSTEVRQIPAHRPRTRSQTRIDPEPRNGSLQKQKSVLKEKKKQKPSRKAQPKQSSEIHQKKQLQLPSEFQYFKHETSTSFDVVNFLMCYSVKNYREARRILDHFVESTQDIHDKTKIHRTLKRLATDFLNSGYSVLNTKEAQDYFRKKGN